MASAPATGIPFLQAPALVGHTDPPHPRPARAHAQSARADQPPPVGARGTDGAIMLLIPPEGPRCSGGSSVVVRHIIRHVSGQCGGLEGVGSHNGEQAPSLICGAPKRPALPPTPGPEGAKAPRSPPGGGPSAAAALRLSPPARAACAFALPCQTPRCADLCEKVATPVDVSPVKFPSTTRWRWILQLAL